MHLDISRGRYTMFLTSWPHNRWVLVLDADLCDLQTWTEGIVVKAKGRYWWPGEHCNTLAELNKDQGLNYHT